MFGHFFSSRFLRFCSGGGVREGILRMGEWESNSYSRLNFLDTVPEGC